MSDLSQLARLAKPFPPKYIKNNPSGGGCAWFSMSA